MSLIDKIKEKVKVILEENFVVQEYDSVPTHSNKSLLKVNTGKKIKVAVLYIDMRGSTKILTEYNRTTVAKLHKSYYEIIIPIIMRMKGRIRSYNGDSLLAFFLGTPQNALGNAVKAASQIKFAFNDKEKGLNQLLDKYTSIDFGVGIDYGQILVTRIGSRDYEYTSDLIWIGHPVNKSVRLGDNARNPYSIYITEKAFEHLHSRLRIIPKKNIFGRYQGDRWEESSFQYSGKSEVCYRTKYDYPVF